MTRLLIVDDHVAYRQAFAEALVRELGIKDVLQAGELAEAKETIVRSEVTIDLALIGRDLSDGSGVELRSHLQGFHPSCQVVVLGIGGSRREWARAIAIGAVGVFPRSVPLGETVDGIRRLLSGESIIVRSERVALLQEATHSSTEEQAVRNALARLTPREYEILHALARGMSDKEAAGQLGVSAKTVATHMASLLDKLGVDSRLKAVLLALRHRAVTLD